MGSPAGFCGQAGARFRAPAAVRGVPRTAFVGVVSGL